RAGPGLAHRPARVRDRRDRHLLLPQLEPGLHPDRRHRRAVRPGHKPAGVTARRPGQPAHGAGGGQAVAGGGLGQPGPAPGQRRGPVRRHVPPAPRGQPRGPGRPVPQGGCVMSTIELSNVSRWYGNVVAINDITMTIGPGVTGLLGPNGAGKSTLLHLAAGFLAPSRGKLTVAGAASWHNPGIYRVVGLVPERDSVYSFLTGEAFVRATAQLHKLPDPQAAPRATAQLHKLPDPEAATRRAIGIVEMADAQDRRISTYSKGMRQRIKVAAAPGPHPP